MKFERKHGYAINHKKIRRIMRDNNLKTKIRRASKFRAIFRQGEECKVAPNLVTRQFDPAPSSPIWTTDITELRYAYGQKAYLSVFKDLKTKQIVSWRLGSRPTIDLAVCDIELRLRTMTKKYLRNLTIHSDQGFQYTSGAYRSVLAEFGVRQSMSRKGNCLDNAPIESFFGHLKDEAEISSCKSLDDLRRSIQRYMKYYNEERPQWGLERKTPAEAGVLSGLVL
jgi:transposase InsO family protein